MVTAAEMSDILGATVAAEPGEGGDSTTCRYIQAGRTLPLAELKVDWGGGSAAMAAAGMLSRHEPGIADPLAGLGDQASAIGPALWIRVGDDLVTLTLFGVDEDVVVAKRILATMRPRMGPSSQPRAADARGGADSSPGIPKEAQALIGNLLGRLGQPEPKAAPSENANTTLPRVEEPTFRSVAGLPFRRIPLVKGLTMVLARHEAKRGDWEGIGTIDGVSPAEVSMVYRADPPDIGPLVIARVVRRVDLKDAHRLYGRFTPGDPVEFPGSTALSFSAAILNDIKTRGETTMELQGNGERITYARVEPEPVAFPVLVNNEAVEVPAIHLRGTLANERNHYYILDDPDNALLLRTSNGVNSSQMVRIAFPVASEPAAIEEKLKKDGRVDVYGIYFDFAKSTLRPESERVLDEIATVLKNNPTWKLKVDGHTDNIGGDDYNVDLSRRRSAAVKSALVERYLIASDRLTTDGLGAARPKASNDTFSGRAQNRRVELVRQ